MKILFVLCFFFSLFVLSFSLPSFAQTSVSQFVNFQGVLVDEGGNVLYDIQQADVRCSVVDGAGTVLYEEIQPDTALINGAISILCGNGVNPSTGAVTGGIPYDVFSPEGSRLLRVQVNDDIPQEEVEIVSVPYSYYSQLALGLANPLEADDITAGVITRTHLHDDLWNQIVELGFGEGALNAHRTESGAHPATSITVENTFVNTPGTNLQQILQGLDNAISIRGNIGEVLDNRLTQEVSDRETADAAETAAREAAITAEQTARETADNTERAAREAAITTEQTARQSADTTLQNNLNTEAATRQNADTTLQNNINVERAAREAADTALQTGVNTAQSTANQGVSDAAAAQSTANSASSAAATAQSTADSKVSKSGDTMTGTLTMNADINMQSGRTVDGVDLSEISPMLAKAWGYFPTSPATGDALYFNGYNISDIGISDPGGDNDWLITFNRDMNNANYSVTASAFTPDEGWAISCGAHSRTAGSFKLRCTNNMGYTHTSDVYVSFVVFGN